VKTVITAVKTVTAAVKTVITANVLYTFPFNSLLRIDC
jgi:hypothetical protein